MLSGRAVDILLQTVRSADLTMDKAFMRTQADLVGVSCCKNDKLKLYSRVTRADSKVSIFQCLRCKMAAKFMNKRLSTKMI